MFSGYKNISTVNYSHFGHQFPANVQVVQELTSELTEHGHPNLQGFWTNPFQTPLERSLALGDKLGDHVVLALISRF